MMLSDDSSIDYKFNSQLDSYNETMKENEDSVSATDGSTEVFCQPSMNDGENSSIYFSCLVEQVSLLNEGSTFSSNQCSYCKILPPDEGPNIYKKLQEIQDQLIDLEISIKERKKRSEQPSMWSSFVTLFFHWLKLFS